MWIRENKPRPIKENPNRIESNNCYFYSYGNSVDYRLFSSIITISWIVFLFQIRYSGNAVCRYIADKPIYRQCQAITPYIQYNVGAVTFERLMLFLHSKFYIKCVFSFGLSQCTTYGILKVFFLLGIYLLMCFMSIFSWTERFSILSFSKAHLCRPGVPHSVYHFIVSNMTSSVAKWRHNMAANMAKRHVPAIES